MKNILIYTSVIFTLIVNGNSQILSEYGLKVGMMSANQLFDYSDNFIIDDEKYNYRYGLNIGIFAEFFKLEYFSLVIDIKYNQKGSVEDLELTYRDDNLQGYSVYQTNLDRRFDYLSINTNIKTRYDFKNFSTYLLTGFRYDIFLGKDLEKLDVFTQYNRLLKSFWEKYDGNIYGLTLGFGVDLENLIDLPIFLEWVYNHDLTSIKMNEALEIQNLSNHVVIGIKF